MADEIFDPEIHATDKDGNPSLNKDGSFRKKRRDAGKGTTKAKGPAPASSGGKVLADQRAGYIKAVAEPLSVIASMVSLVDPVDGYCAAQLVDPWAEVLGDLAMEYPQLAAAIERAKVVGPLAGLVGVGILTVAQFGHNHNKVPAHLARMLGARPRTEIETILKQRGAQMAAEAEERQRQDAEEAQMASEIAEQLRAERAGAVSHEYADAV